MKTFDTFYSEYRDRLNSSVQEIASEMSGGPYSPSEFAGKLIAANQMVNRIAIPIPIKAPIIPPAMGIAASLRKSLIFSISAHLLWLFLKFVYNS